MNHISEYQPFAEKTALLAGLKAEEIATQAERDQILAALSDQLPVVSLSVEDQARAIVAGDSLPATGQNYRDLVAKEPELRERLSQIAKLKADLPARIERAREDAAVEWRHQHSAEFAKIRSAFDAATVALIAACQAEDKLLREMALSGFGRQEPWTATAHWLDRNMLLGR